MSVIDFPNTPVLNQSFAAGNGATYKWNGTMWITVPGSASSGNVVGPATSTDNAIARYDGTTGKLLQDSWVTVSDTGVIDGTFATFSGTVTANMGVIGGLIYGPLAATGTNAGFGGDGTNVGIRTYSGGGLYFQGPAGVPTWGYFDAGALHLLTPLIGTTATFSGTLKAGKTGLNGANPDATAGLTFGTTLGGNGLNGVYVYDDGTGISGMGITANTLNVYSGGNQVKIGVSALKAGAGSMTDVATFGPGAMTLNGTGYFNGDVNGVHTGVAIQNANAGDNAVARLLLNLSGTPNGYALIEASNFGTSPGVVSYFAGDGFPGGHVFNSGMTINAYHPSADVRGGLRLTGIGQDSNNPVTATGQQATINIESNNVNSGTGGMIKFSMAGGVGYAAIKGQGVNGSGNTQGGIGFSTRRNQADATLTEAMRIEYTGLVVMDADVTVAGQIRAVTASISNTVLVGFAGTYGAVTLQQGGVANTGYVEFMQADATRAAYIGYGNTATGGIAYQLDKPGSHTFGGGPVVANNTLRANLVGINRDGLGNVSLAIKATSTGANWLHYCVDSADAFRFGVSDGGFAYAKGLDVDGITFNNALTAKFSTVDGGISGLFCGQSKGVRIINTATGSQIEGVDNSGGVSYQPLALGGSEVNAPTPPAADNSTKIATTAWVRANGGVTAIGTTPPASPTNGQLWWNSDGNVSGGGNLYINYNDGNTTQWIVAAVGAPGPQGPPGAWVQMTQSAYDALPTKNATTLYVIVG